MTDAERREAARQFFQKWVGKGKEDEDDRSYWLDILQRILGISDATDRIEFQKKVIVDGNTKKIDAYIPETKIIIEQKTLGISLDKKGHQSGGIDLTPYEQAKRYNDNLPSSEKARWIITSNFSEIWIYDMDTKVPEQNITKINISDLQTHYSMLTFLASKKVKKINEEMELSLEAGDLVGRIYDSFLSQYNNPNSKEAQNSLNVLCVRLVFCLYAEDAGLFDKKDAFKSYIEQFEPGKIRRALIDLFEVLNTPIEERSEMYLDDDLASFPYVNGGLFERENIEIPKITEEIKEILIESAAFNWSRISPTIFGAVFESTLNPETRRSGGMHYTSIENIHKVIDPLFLDDLKIKLEEIKNIKIESTRKKKLQIFQNKLASLKWLDPACGSGNFLTETYISIRRLENEILKILNKGQISFGFEEESPIKVSIDQFYGIEINDFAVTVAKTALWIAESQMMKETEDIVHMNLDFLPLKTNAYIHEGNALKMDWNNVVHKNDLSYIMGNPPFVGSKKRSKEQREDVKEVLGSWNNAGNLDYVCCWFKLASDYISDTNIEVAFVSTNSITQGEEVASLWRPLKNDGIHINFAYRTFQWDSEAKIKAHVHCVIIGFSKGVIRNNKIIYDGASVIPASNINGYLMNADDIYLDRRREPICDVPSIIMGPMSLSGNHLILTEEEKDDLLMKEPAAKKWVRRFSMGKEFIDGSKRYCLWLVGISPSELNSLREVKKHVEACKKYREESTPTGDAYKLRDIPHLFRPSAKFKEGVPYFAMPQTSSQNRRYIPMDFVDNGMIPGQKLYIIPEADLYLFGILTSNVHMSWMRTVCGRMKSDYSYSVFIVYNNFPWPSPTTQQKQKIEQTAQGILDARALYPDSSLADLYDPLTMPPELRKAHQRNDAAVMQAYGMSIKDTSESDCVAKLMKMYQKLIQDIK